MTGPSLAAATSSGGEAVIVLIQWIVPILPVARAMATSPSGWTRPIEPIGAVITGSASGMPRKVVLVSIWLTSRSTRGRKT
jgi:hypothetical protein